MSSIINLIILCCVIIHSVTSFNSTLERKIQTRINNGKPANRKNWPFMARLVVSNIRDKFGCSGTIISNRHILTAAHCLFDCGNKYKCLDDIEIILGVADISKINDEHRKTYFAVREDVHIHEKYNGEASVDDIAIIPLQEDIIFNDYIQKAELPKPSKKSLEGKTVAVAGWGLMKDGTLPRILQETTVDIVNSRECNEYSFSNSNEQEHICAEGIGTSTCQGDSGGPYIIREKKGYFKKKNVNTVVGIAIYGFGECKQASPEVAINVAHYLPWIKNKMAVKI